MQAASILELNKNSKLELLNQQTDKQGVTATGFTRLTTWHSYRKFCYIIHARNGKMTGMSGEIIIDFDGTVNSLPLQNY